MARSGGLEIGARNRSRKEDDRIEHQRNGTMARKNNPNLMRLWKAHKSIKLQNARMAF